MIPTAGELARVTAILLIGLLAVFSPTADRKVHADPSPLTVLAPSTASCGATMDVVVYATNDTSAPVADNTSVTFTTTVGIIASPRMTLSGMAVSQLYLPYDQPGPVKIFVSELDQSQTATVQVIC